jgi:hypothetical protein
MRWPWSDPASLELLSGTPINCLLLKTVVPDFVQAAAARGVVTLALIAPDGDVAGAARRAMAARISGIVIDGDLPEGAAAGVREAAGGAPVIELTARNRMALGSDAAILGTYQGVWPGIAVEEDGAKKAAPSGSVWIDTNTGFIRAVRAWGAATLWMANQPPPKTVVTGARYLQVIADAAISGARWVLALDDDFASRLARHEPKSVADWKRMADLLRYFEQHPEWRNMQEYGCFRAASWT